MSAALAARSISNLFSEIDLPSVAPSVPSRRPARTQGPHSAPLALRSGGGRTLPEDPAILAWLGQRLVPGETTLWFGRHSAIGPLLELLYAGSAAVGGEISLIEGANRFHPFRIGELGRGFGVAPGEALHRIRLARAFTAHQLVALVDGWAGELRRRRPTLLVAHELPTLFEAEEEVRPEEREALLRHVAERLRAMMDRASCPLLLVQDGGFDRFPSLLDAGPRFADLITFARHPRGLALRSYRDDARVRLVHRPDGQRGIEEFSSDEREVIAWAAPHPPIAKRSTSG
ncbi:MAG: hypothetical protein ACREB9_00585 [Thermoplasmata archaeon]